MLERPFSLAGKCILVVGAGTGIGKGVALELARQGADVALSYSGSYQGAMDAVEQIKAFGRRAVALQANISLVADCRRVVDEAVHFLGGLDGLFNNAGLTFTKPFEQVTEEVGRLLGLPARQRVHVPAVQGDEHRPVRLRRAHPDSPVTRRAGDHPLAG